MYPRKQLFIAPHYVVHRIHHVNVGLPGTSRSGLGRPLRNLLSYGTSLAPQVNSCRFAFFSPTTPSAVVAALITHASYTVRQRGWWRISSDASMQHFYSDLEKVAPMTTHIQGNVPLRVFLNLIEAIALQEDVKYFTLNGNLLKANQGRINNLITTAGVIRYLGGYETISWLVGGLSRNPPGVLSLSQGDLREFFPPIP